MDKKNAATLSCYAKFDVDSNEKLEGLGRRQ
jgi:hypothetical protein